MLPKCRFVSRGKQPLPLPGVRLDQVLARAEDALLPWFDDREVLRLALTCWGGLLSLTTGTTLVNPKVKQG